MTRKANVFVRVNLSAHINVPLRIESIMYIAGFTLFWYIHLSFTRFSCDTAQRRDSAIIVL